MAHSSPGPSTDAAKLDKLVIPVSYSTWVSGVAAKSPLTMSIVPLGLTDVTMPT